jgi:phytoene/squalene synthetase
VYGIYGFVRIADEIVDSFHGYDKETLLKEFRESTTQAIERGISLNPILHSFQHAVHTYHIEWELIDTFLKSMEMDLAQTQHDAQSYSQYILGSAEVVGLMCLRVFVGGNHDLYHALKPSAMKLGAAFQKVNFLRDLKDDYHTLGRTYFPEVNFNRFSQADKDIIEADIEADFREAIAGIKRLPNSSRLGVYVAYVYYYKLFLKIKNTPAEEVMEMRIRIPDSHKFLLLCQSFIRHKLNRI